MSLRERLQSHRDGLRDKYDWARITGEELDEIIVALPQEDVLNGEDDVDGIDLIVIERERPVPVNVRRPNPYRDRELLMAAGCYLAAGRIAQLRDDTATYLIHPPPLGEYWPWKDEDWAPSDDAVPNLAKAAAFIAIEIDRLLSR